MHLPATLELHMGSLIKLLGRCNKMATIYGTSTRQTSHAQPKVAVIFKRRLPKVLIMQVRSHCLLQVHGAQQQSNT